MLTIRKRRFYFIFFITIGVSLAVGLSLFALRNNINLYLTPAQVYNQHMQPGKMFRLGGLVVKGSVHHDAESLDINFGLTDFHRTIKVDYHGLLPSLFREGQGIIAEGHLNVRGIFIADQVLAKHDAYYRPPEIPVARVKKINEPK